MENDEFKTPSEDNENSENVEDPGELVEDPRDLIDDEPGYAPAIAVPEVRAAIRFRRLKVLLAVVIVISITTIISQLLVSFDISDRLAIALSLAGLASLVALFVIAIVYLVLARDRHILRKNPWVIWRCSVRVASLGGTKLFRIVELEHDEWPNMVRRVIIKRKGIVLLEDCSGDEILVAGNPKRTLIVATHEFDFIARARRPIKPFLRG